MIPLKTLFFRQLVKEAIIQRRDFRGIFNACLFFLMILVFFSLTLPPELPLLRLMAPGMVWIALLFALLLSAERLFQSEQDEGVIEQWLVSPYPLSLWVAVKLLLQWFFLMVPILLLCPLCMLLFGFNGYETWALMLGLLCGSPVLLLLCALAAAFSLGLQQKGVFMALVVLPLTIPVLILGSSMVNAAFQTLNVSGYAALLLAMTCLSMALLPWAIAGVIRIGGE